MGKSPHLTRLALGRSAYQPLLPAAALEANDFRLDAYGQTYDESGKPFNLSSSALTEALITAKNEVFAAVGVTERKAPHDRSRRIVEGSEHDDDDHETQDGLLALENQVGEQVASLAKSASIVSTWWITSIRFRYQAGMIDPSQGLFRLFNLRKHFLATPRLGAPLLLLAGYPATVAANFFMRFSYLFLDATTTLLHNAILIPHSASKNQARRRRALVEINIAARLGLVVLSSPFHIWSLLQRLDMLDSTLSLPPASWLLPWRAESPLSWGWSAGPDTLSVFDQCLNMAVSPVALLITYAVLGMWTAELFAHESLEQDLIAPRGKDEDEYTLSGEGESMPNINSVRTRILRFLGWSRKRSKLPGPTDTRVETTILLARVGATDAEAAAYTAREVEGDANTSVSTWRVSSRPPSTLSLLPATFLASSLAELSSSIIKIPLTTLLARSTLICWRVLGPGAPTGIDSELTGPIWRRILLGEHESRFSFWTSAGKIGLCLCADAAVRTVLWGAVCASASTWCSWRSNVVDAMADGGDCDDQVDE